MIKKFSSTAYLGIIVALQCMLSACASVESKYHEEIQNLKKANYTILFDSLYTDGFDIIYCNETSLFRSTNKDKSPIELYNKNKVSELTTVSYSLNTDKIKDGQVLIQKKEGKVNVTPYDGQNHISTDCPPNIFAAYEPKKLYAVKWPWVLIGRSYVAHVSDPGTLIDVDGLIIDNPEFKDMPVDPINMYTDGPDILDRCGIDNQEKSFYIKQAIDAPGYTNYHTSQLNQNCWIGPAYMPEKYWHILDGEPDVDELLTFTPESNDVGYIEIKIDQANKLTVSEDFEWRENQIPLRNGLTSATMLPYYKQRESDLQQQLDFKNDRILDAVERVMNSKVTDFFVLHNDYRANPYKAEELYPLGNVYYAKLNLSSIREGERGYNYTVEAVAWKRDGIDYNEITLYTDDSRFVNAEYSDKEYYIKGRLARIPYVGTVLYNAELIF